MHLVNSKSYNGNNRTRREEVGEPEPISTMDGSIGLSGLWPGLDFLQSVHSLAVSLAGSRPDPHAVHLLGLKEVHPVWLPNPRDFVLLFLPGPFSLGFCRE